VHYAIAWKLDAPPLAEHDESRRTLRGFIDDSVHRRHIRSLEAYLSRCGARLVRGTLPESVHGRMGHDQITVRAGLDSEQELLTLVHEIAHWLAHRNAGLPPTHCAACTIFEYEAEAVEALVMSRLGLSRTPQDPTDDLLSASVARVTFASNRICQALGLEVLSPIAADRRPAQGNGR
jgi:hypothetical protein